MLYFNRMSKSQNSVFKKWRFLFILRITDKTSKKLMLSSCFLKLLIIISASITSISGFSSQKIQEYFEWGEYSKLINILQPYLDLHSDSTDSVLFAKYHSYLGVAYFSTERIGDARNHFLKAIQYYPQILLPKEYITPEIADLFISIKLDFDNRKKQKFLQDSILIAKQMEYEFNLKKAASLEFENRKRSNAILAGSFSLIGAAFLGISTYQYYATREPFTEFKQAASDGNKIQYERLQPDIKRSNTIILTCNIASGVTFFTSLVFSIKTFRIKRNSLQ